MKKLIFIICNVFLLSINCNSQDQQLIDSLLHASQSSTLDTNKVNSLNELCRQYYINSSYDTALYYAGIAQKLAEKINYKKGLGNADYNMGVVYTEQGDLPKALKNYFAALRIFESIENKNRIASASTCIGSVYSEMNNLTEALKYHTISLEIFKQTGYQRGLAASYNNIGSIYIAQENYSEALKSFYAALKINEETGNKNWVAVNYSNMAKVYACQKNFKEALKIMLKSLTLVEENTNRHQIAILYNKIGIYYYYLNNVIESKKWLQKGLAISLSVGAKPGIMSAYSWLSNADSALGNYKAAFENYKKYVLYNDSIFNEENTKKITQQEMQFEFDKKEALGKAEQEKKDALALEEIENQKLVRNGFIGGFAIVLVFAGTFFRQRNRIKKEKKRSDHLLRNILPDEVAEELKETGGSKAKTYSMVSVMFTDFKDFTKISEKVSAELLVNELHTCFSAFDNILHKHNIEKIKTIGDAYMCVSGLPLANESHASDMVKAALEIMDYVVDRKKEKDARNEFSFDLRIGINSGPVVAGIVGLKKFSYDIWGDTVNTANRLENQGEAGKINISGSTYELVKDKFTCEHRGKITAKNKGEIDMYFVAENSFDKAVF